jgi:hypothetical protein
MLGLSLFRSKNAHLFTDPGDTQLLHAIVPHLKRSHEAGFAAATEGHPLHGKMYRAEALVFWIAMAVLAFATVEFVVHFVQFLRD